MYTPLPDLMPKQPLLYTSLLICLLMNSCATPVAPTGGPPDREPPQIIGTTPDVGTINFSDDEVRFEFSKFPDRASVRQNVTIEPNIGIRYEVNFRRKTAIVEFQDELPENTTILVKLGAEISDTRNNEMGSSFDMAFSTGPVIDTGEITARLRDADKETVESGERVFLFREPVDYTEGANYVAQSDTSGEISFSYLREGTYSAIWVDDLNRDRSWNPDREQAQPFHSERIEVEQGEEVNIGTIYIQRPDTLSPRLEGVGLLSEERLRMRISEEVFWEDGAIFSIRDSLGEAYTTGYPLYKDVSDPNILLAQVEDPLTEEMEYRVETEGFADRSENTLRVDVDPFQGSAEPDTTLLRIITSNADSGLFPDESFEIIYSKFIDDEAVTDSLLVFEGDQRVDEYEFVDTIRNRLVISPDGEWDNGTRYRFDVWDPDFEERRTLEPDIWRRNQLGGIEFLPADGDTSTTTRLRLFDEDRKVEIDTVFTGSVEIDRLPPVEYTAKLYRTEDAGEPWNPGTVDPFRAPDPYFVRSGIPVREGFTSELEVEFSGESAEMEPLSPDDLEIDLNQEN